MRLNLLRHQDIQQQLYSVVIPFLCGDLIAFVKCPVLGCSVCFVRLWSEISVGSRVEKSFLRSALAMARTVPTLNTELV